MKLFSLNKKCFNNFNIYPGDLTATKKTSVYVSKILKHLNTIQPEVVPMFHFLRIWFSTAGIQLKNYVLYILLLFYLQQDNYMPSIKHIQKNIEKDYCEGKLNVVVLKFFQFFFSNFPGAEVQFNPELTLNDYAVDKIKNYKDFIHEFFKFYIHFRFDGYAVSTYQGQRLPRIFVEPVCNMLFEMNMFIRSEGPLGTSSSL